MPKSKKSSDRPKRPRENDQSSSDEDQRQGRRPSDCSFAFTRPPTTNHVSLEMVVDCGTRRAVTVVDSLSPHELHLVVQELFGWDNYHLHLFRIERHSVPKVAPTKAEGKSSSDDDDEEAVKSTYDVDFAGTIKPNNDGFHNLAELVPISTCLGRLGAEIEYEYDFGDQWCVGIRVTKIVPNTTFVQPYDVSCKGRAPEEDSRCAPHLSKPLQLRKTFTPEELSIDVSTLNFEPEGFNLRCDE